ncbi:DUF2339 domain-containing protein, partial [Xanthomonas hortorum]|uniref:DUF2339 domain-containing protein n=1 Tax=Xanthomonas hortorum TaxID=56454 RepID=UPI001F381DFC
MIGLVVLFLLALPVGLVIALVWIAGLRRRVDSLEQRLAQWQASGVGAGAADAAAVHTPMPTPFRTWEPQQDASDVGVSTFGEPDSPRAADLQAAPVSVVTMPPSFPAEAPASSAARSAGDAPISSTAPAQAEQQPQQQSQYIPSEPGPIARAASAVKRWFTEGNVPVKVGMLVLLAGVASLLKYASDQGWMRMPVELRLAGISVLALAGLVFGWKQRLQRPGFALALQGGAIGGLLLTVFAAFKLYGLLGAGLAMGISVVLIAGMCVLAVVQDSRTLAVLGVLAGFLAPIWLSTGTGNHVALFSYYAVLNAGIVAIAWTRPWRVLNLLGFAFTFGIGTLWGALQYSPAKFASTEPFLLLFFAMYVAIPVLHARRGDGSAGKVIDGSLLFGTPLVAFALQARLLEGDRLPLALCALAVAVLYAGLASWLLRRVSTR